MLLCTPRIKKISERPCLKNYILRFKQILERSDFSVLKVSQPGGSRRCTRTLQVAFFVSTHTVDLVRYIIEIWALRQVLLLVKNHMECRLFYLKSLKGLNVGEVLPFVEVAFVFAS